MRDYEVLLLIRSNLDDAGAVVAAQNIAERIKSLNGAVTSTNVWGRRKLAYPIDKQLEATYILLKFKADPPSLRDLEFNLKLDEDLLRYLLVKDMTPETAVLQEAESQAAEAPADAETVAEDVSAETTPHEPEEAGEATIDPLAEPEQVEQPAADETA